MKKIFIVLISFLFALSFTSCSKKPDESKVKTSLTNYFEKKGQFLADDLNLPPDKDAPSYGVGMVFYKEVKITSIDITDSRKSSDGNSYEYTCKISGTAFRYINMGMNQQHTSVYEIKDKSVSFADLKYTYTINKDKFDEWNYNLK